MKKEILELFKVVIVDEDQLSTEPVLDYVSKGLVLNFTPTKNQLSVLKSFYKPLDVNTLFTREERDNADPFHLITKQLLHYLEVYGLNTPGLFDLEVSEGKICPMTLIRGITEDELGDMVRKLIYANAPVRDAVALKEIIQKHNIEVDISKVANNELRVGLFNVDKDTFQSGDDAVRYMCYAATDSLLLIKSKQVVDAIATAKTDKNPLPVSFFERHTVPLAQVFNRHKRLILAAKNSANRTVINKIARLSKTKHVPLHESVAKRFVTDAVKYPVGYDFSVLDKVSLRDKFKFLNLLAYKKEQMSIDAFVIRNGKVFVKSDREYWSKKNIKWVEEAILNSLKSDLADLKGKNILLDANVDYGLPVSRKQVIGQLPFGTRVSVEDNEISAGMYWENAWGARDLDLSTINTKGDRTGWGMYSGYDRNNPITFSGDITDARNGAMEFMTSSESEYGLFVNIFSGEIGCQMELVVGGVTVTKQRQKWIDNPVIREKITLNSRGNIIGFVRNHEFIVYTGRLGNGRMSGTGNASIVKRGMCDSWTVKRLFDAVGVKYDVEKNADVEYDLDLTYSGFSYDKLEKILLD